MRNDVANERKLEGIRGCEEGCVDKRGGKRGSINRDFESIPAATKRRKNTQRKWKPEGLPLAAKIRADGLCLAKLERKEKEADKRGNASLLMNSSVGYVRRARGRNAAWAPRAVFFFPSPLAGLLCC